MNESRQPFTIHQARKNTISLEDFKRMMLKRAKVQAVADILAPNGSGNVEDDGVHVPATEFSQLMNAPMSGVTSDAFEAALNAASQQQLKQQQLHPLAATRRGHLVQSRKEALSRSRLDEWQSQENQRQQDYTTAVEQHAAQKARLLAAAAEKQAEVQRLEADAEGRQRLQAELRTQQQQLFVFKQALVEQMQQTNRASNPPLRSSTNSDASTVYAPAHGDARLSTSGGYRHSVHQQQVSEVMGAAASVNNK